MPPVIWNRGAADGRPRPYMAALRVVVTTEGCENAKCKIWSPVLVVKSNVLLERV